MEVRCEQRNLDIGYEKQPVVAEAIVVADGQDAGDIVDGQKGKLGDRQCVEFLSGAEFDQPRGRFDGVAQQHGSGDPDDRGGECRFGAGIGIFGASDGGGNRGGVSTGGAVEQSGGFG